MTQSIPAHAINFQYSALESVTVGESVNHSLPRAIQRAEAKRVLMLASATLARNTENFSELKQACQGSDSSIQLEVFSEIRAHTPREDVLTAIQLANDFDADLLVSLGGGSIIDATKVVQLALDQNLNSAEELLVYAQASDGSRGAKAGDMTVFSGSPIRQIAVPTTLSGAEFSNNAGVLDTQKSAKEGYKGIDLCPREILYDPELATRTPEWLWLSTAIRSLDHAIEGYCSSDAHPFVQGHFLHAMRLFAQSLPGTKTDPKDLESRSLNQHAVWLACCGLGTISHGASHGIGYILGSLCGVPHGYTSCVMLPAVLEWNSKKLSVQQKPIATALGKPELSAADGVKNLLLDLGLPTSLQEVGVESSLLEEISKRAFKHPVVRNNPSPIDSPQQIEEILQLAW